jgi:hypothetical protein
MPTSRNDPWAYGHPHPHELKDRNQGVFVVLTRPRNEVSQTMSNLLPSVRQEGVDSDIRKKSSRYKCGEISNGVAPAVEGTDCCRM